MKNNILKLTLISTMTMASLTSFSQQDKKVEKARKNLAEAKTNLAEAKIDLTEAKTDSVADYMAFKKEAELSIAENKKKIADLKAKRTESINEERAKYDKKVLAIEEKNQELENKINGSSNIKTSMWTSFKADFREGIKNLGGLINEVGIIGSN